MSVSPRMPARTFLMAAERQLLHDLEPYPHERELLIECMDRFGAHLVVARAPRPTKAKGRVWWNET